MMPGKGLAGQHRGSDQGRELDSDGGISNFSYVPIIPPLLSVSNNDLLTDQRVDRVFCTGWKTEFYLSQNSSIFHNKRHFLSIIFHHEIV